MKLAILSESEADEAAVHVLADAVLGQATELIRPARRARGYNQVLQVLQSVYKQLHYHTDVDGLIVVVDTDDSLLPDAAPHAADTQAQRITDLKHILQRFVPHLALRTHAPPLRIAIGVAAPAIEAWLLSHCNPRLSEAAWIQGQRERRAPYTRRSLKMDMYGSVAPTLSLEKAKMVEAARLVNIDSLCDRFPHGFAPLAVALRSWLDG